VFGTKGKGFLSNPEKIINQALQLHQSGKVQEAINLYLKVLPKCKNDANLLYLLGTANVQVGRLKQGIEQLQKSVSINPKNPFAFNNLGQVLQGLKRPDEALINCNKAISIKPDYAEAYNIRGIALADLKRLDEALRSCDEAIAINPGYAEAHINRGVVLADLKRLDEALHSYDQAIAINPGYAKPYYNRGILLQNLNRLDEALRSFDEAIAINPRFAEAHINRGAVLAGLNRLDEALHSYDQAIAVNPGYGEAYTNKAALLIRLGRIDEAKPILSEAIRLQSDQANALSKLYSLRRRQRDDPLFAQITSIYQGRESLPPEDRERLDFAYGKALEDVGEYDDAFAAYAEGNRLHFAAHPFDEAESEHFASRTRATFSAELLRSCRAIASELPDVDDDRVPVFIVGMPRSGSTLIEQVLSSHASLHGAGELNNIYNIAKTVKPPGAQASGLKEWFMSLRALGQSYLDEVWKLAPSARFITDKMPGNFLNIGLLQLMLPHARIIHALREPMDCCFSCYALRFTEGHEYCYDLSTLGRYYVRYSEMMQHWHAVLMPGQILDVRYEDMVSDLEGQTRRLLDYIGLPWDPTCLKFYENNRAVNTASAMQVRQPIYNTSVARWKHFEKHLAPLLDTLGNEYKISQNS
jgi:tetratricopeptide (TPR) repeat protein